MADYFEDSEIWIHPYNETGRRLKGNGFTFATGTGDWTRWMFYELFE